MLPLLLLALNSLIACMMYKCVYKLDTYVHFSCTCIFVCVCLMVCACMCESIYYMQLTFDLLYNNEIHSI